MNLHSMPFNHDCFYPSTLMVQDNISKYFCLKVDIWRLSKDTDLVFGDTVGSHPQLWELEYKRPIALTTAASRYMLLVSSLHDNLSSHCQIYFPH